MVQSRKKEAKGIKLKEKKQSNLILCGFLRGSRPRPRPRQ
jgi:hypothetical protein